MPAAEPVPELWASSYRLLNNGRATKLGEDIATKVFNAIVPDGDFGGFVNGALKAAHQTADL